MAGKRDILWVADAIVTELQENLPAKLDSLDAEYADGIELEDVADENYHVAELRRPNGFPLVCVIPNDSDLVPLTGEAHYEMEQHSLTISVAVTHNEGEDDLKRRCVRTLRGIWEVLDDDITLGGNVVQVLPIAKRYGPMLTSNKALLQEGQLEVRVTTTT